MSFIVYGNDTKETAINRKNMKYYKKDIGLYRSKFDQFKFSLNSIVYDIILTSVVFFKF